jgi:hypothetical protein
MENRRRHKDFNQIAKFIVDTATNPKETNEDVVIGRLGGLKGGKARADSLTPERRSEIAKAAAAKRWAK